MHGEVPDRVGRSPGRGQHQPRLHQLARVPGRGPAVGRAAGGLGHLGAPAGAAPVQPRRGRGRPGRRGRGGVVPGRGGGQPEPDRAPPRPQLRPADRRHRRRSTR